MSTDTQQKATGEFVIIVDPDAVVTAAKNEHVYHRNGNEVLTVRPPFDGETVAQYRFSQAGNHWPPEMDPKPLDLSASVFINDDKRTSQYPTWSEIRAAIRDEEDIELSDETEREWYDEAVAVWETGVRRSLKREIDINEEQPKASKRVPVRYEHLGDE